MGSMSALNRIEFGPFRADYLLHSVVFLPWMFFFLVGWKEQSVPLSRWMIWLVLGILLAVAMESLQLAISYRAFNPMDAAFNVLGVVLGGVLVVVIKWIKSCRAMGF